MRTAVIVIAAALTGGPASAADYVLSLTDTGKREYYCQIMVTLENRSDTVLTEISGHFLSYLDEAQVGRSKGAWFMNVPPGGRAEAVFETPNAPCDAVERYAFIVGACRLGPDFAPQSVCAERMAGAGAIEIAVQ